MEQTQTSGRIGEVFWAFLALGLTSFGGPVAHLGYFRTAFVERRQWLTESAYADLVALCQFLPGPASSQVGFALGLLRAGPWGAAMAWLAFTLPSAIILLLFALGAAVLDGPIASGIIHGLKVVAVAIVAHAVWGMARNLCPDKTRVGIALAAVFTVVVVSGPLGQVAAIVLGGLVGLALCRNSAAIAESAPLHFPVSRRAGLVALGLFGGLLILLPLMAGGTVWLNVIDAFYRSGALVFGGGHVVLPLLEAEVVQSGWITPDEFLAGYGAAQAVPGPLFTFAAYLGALLPGMNGVVGALLALLAIFYPRVLAAGRRAAVLEPISSVGQRSGANARCQCGGRRYFRRSALSAGMDQRDHWGRRVCAGAHRVLAVNRMEAARLGGGGCCSVRGSGDCAVSNDT